MLKRIRANVAGMHEVVCGASRRFGAPKAILWARLLWRYSVDRFSLAELRAYAPLVPEVLQTLPVLISKEASLARLARINSSAQQWQTENKEKFYEICERNGIPHPPVAALVGGGRNSRTRELPEHFVSKDQSGAYASGFAAFQRIDADHVRVNSGPPELLDDVLERMARGRRTLILQERLFDHPDLQDLSGKKGLQTARLNTYRTKDGTYRLLFWMIKLLVGDNVSDNFSGGRSGNLIAVGNRDDGHLLYARALDRGNVGLTTLHHHPDTGRSLNSFTVPTWSEAVETVLRAHRFFPHFGALGWDVAITSSGPVVLEANAWWDPPSYAPQVMSADDWRSIFGYGRASRKSR